MPLCKLRLELERLAARFVRLSQVELARVEVRVEKRIAIGDARVRARILWIDLDRLIEHLPGVLETFATKLMKVLATAQIIIVRLNVHGPRLLDLLLLTLGENYAQRNDDRLRDLVLNRENVFHLAVIAL